MRCHGFVSWGILAGLFICSPGSAGAAAAAQAAGVDAAGIVQRANAAMGCGIVGKDTTITASGSLKASSIPNPMPVTIYSQGNRRWRSELDTPKEHKVTIVNEGKGQMQHADGRVAPLTERNTSHQQPTHIPCLTNLSLPPRQVEATYLRTEPANGDSLDVIELLPANPPSVKKLADRLKTTLWISRSTGYLVKMQYINAAERGFDADTSVEVSYSDYRVVDGLAVPFRQVTVDGQLTLELVLDSVQLNTPAADFTLREANAQQK
jgi:hypothetical protein